MVLGERLRCDGTGGIFMRVLRDHLDCDEGIDVQREDGAGGRPLITCRIAANRSPARPPMWGNSRIFEEIGL